MFQFNIMLIGFMGVGKSSISDCLKKKTGMKEIDMDAVISQEAGMPITEIFDKFGEEHFRGLETALLERLQGEKGCIISCGGGAVLRSRNVEVMREQGTIVLLTAEPETIFERVKSNNSRPVLNGHMNVEYIKELMAKRQDAYDSAADIRISTDGKTIEQIADEIIITLEGA